MAKTTPKKKKTKKPVKGQTIKGYGRGLTGTSLVRHTSECTVCQSEFRGQIDALLLQGVPRNRIAKAYELSESAVRRHFYALGLHGLIVKNLKTFWTGIMKASLPRVKGATLDHGLRASELMGRATKAFKEEGDGDDRRLSLDIFIQAERDAKAKKKK